MDLAPEIGRPKDRGTIMGDRKKPAKTSGKAKKAALKATRAQKQEKRSSRDDRPMAMPPANREE
ncbi:hypothetical protein GCM10022221_43780 [Actinocorallia aurea]